MSPDRMFADPATLSESELLADARALYDEWRRRVAETGAAFDVVPTQIVDHPVLCTSHLHALAGIKLRQAREARERRCG